MSFIDLAISVFAKIAAGFLVAFSSIWLPTTSTTVSPSPTPIEHATTTTKLAATSTKPDPVVAISPTPTTTTPTVKPKPLPAPAPAPTIPQTPVTTPIIGETVSPITVSDDLNSQVRAALVNVLCTTEGGGLMKPISGSGVIIDPRGVVLTNAHIGQFFLLRDYPFKDNIQCILRTGSPAVATYTAQLLYFPQSWASANAEKIVQDNPTGTGEHDFALLLITGRTNPAASLPSMFPYIAPYIGDSVDTGTDVLLAGYPAGFLSGATIQTNLYITSAITKIGQVFTFVEGGGADLFSVGGTILSQKGSSGGAVVRESDTKLAGLIVTASIAETTAERDLRAITLRHINKSMTEDAGASLSSYVSGDLLAKAVNFNINNVPTLAKMFTNVLDRQ